MKIPGRNRLLILFLISFFLIFIGFSFNAYRAAPPIALNTYGKISESMVVGRLAETQKNGLFSSGGFLGFALREGDTAENFQVQHRIYTDHLEYKNFNTYRTITGFNGFVFGLIDELTGFSNAFNLKLFAMINSFLAALSLALIISFILYYTGFWAWLFALLSIIFSISLTAFGSNLFFCTWAFYVPFLVVAFILFHEEITGKYSPKKSLFFIFLGITIKCLFNGMEFISSTLVMMMLPVFFFAIKNHWKLKLLARRFAMYSVVAIVGVIFILSILAAQISIYDGSFRSGPDHIVMSWFKRTSEVSTDYKFNPLEQRSLEARLTDALKYQMKAAAYKFDWNLFRTHYRLLTGTATYGMTLLAGLIMSMVQLFFFLIRKRRDKDQQNALAMLVMAWISLLAPLSWFVIFKGHAFIHQTLVTLVWYLPFIIFAAAVSGLAVNSISTAFFSFFSRSFHPGQNHA